MAEFRRAKGKSLEHEDHSLEFLIKIMESNIRSEHEAKMVQARKQGLSKRNKQPKDPDTPATGKGDGKGKSSLV